MTEERKSEDYTGRINPPDWMMPYLGQNDGRKPKDVHLEAEIAEEQDRYYTPRELRQ